GQRSRERQVETEVEAARRFVRPSREAVEDAADPRGAIVAQDRQRVVPGFSRVDDDRQPDLARQVDLIAEGAALVLAGREIVVVIEADLADGDRLGTPGRLADVPRDRGGPVLRLVRVDAGGEMDEVVQRRQVGAGGGVADERGHRDQALDPRGPGARDHLVAVGIEVLQRQVGVAVAEQGRYFTFQPGGTGSSVVRMYGWPPASEAASSIPCETTPLSLAGLRLATTTTVLPTSDSGLYFAAMPATMVRVPVPMSTVSFSSLSAPCTFSAATIFAVRRSTLAKSSMAISAGPAAAACGAGAEGIAGAGAGGCGAVG